MEKITLVETRLTELKARLAALKAAGASKRQLAPLRTELQVAYNDLRCAKLEAEIKANWIGVAILERLNSGSCAG